MIAARAFAGEQVLVTGANGFIGSHLCSKLRSVEAKVHAVFRNASESAALGVESYRGDLSDTAWSRQLIGDLRPQFIFHLAGEVTGSRSPEGVLPTLRGNLLTTVNILSAAQEVGCRRILLAGSLEEPENRNGVPCSPYAAAKSAATAYARMFRTLYQLPVAIMRIFMVYGPGQRDLQKLVPYVILAALRGEAPKLSSGMRLVDWIYVDDVVRGFLRAAVIPGGVGKTVELGSGELISIRRVVEMILQNTNANVQAEFGALPDRPMEQVRKADVEATEKLLDWKAETELEEGLQKTIEWYKENLDDLEKSVFPPVSSMNVRS